MEEIEEDRYRTNINLMFLPLTPSYALSQITWALHSQIHVSYEYLLYRYGVEIKEILVQLN